MKPDSKQLKFLVDAEMRSAFKSACKEAGVSMAGELTAHMAGFIQAGKRRPLPHTCVRTSTRGERRRSLKTIVSALESIKDAEEGYLERIPDSLTNALAYQAAESTVEMMEEAISLLEEAFG